MIGDAMLIHLALIRSCHTDHGERNCLCTWLSYKFGPTGAPQRSCGCRRRVIRNENGRNRIEAFYMGRLVFVRASS
jgi:hypothetical protein